EGAIRVATLLSKLTGRRIAWCMPPEGVKDLREWLKQSKDVNVDDKARCHQMGRDVLIWARANLRWVDPPSGEGRKEDTAQTSRIVRDCTYRRENRNSINIEQPGTSVHTTGKLGQFSTSVQKIESTHLDSVATSSSKSDIPGVASPTEDFPEWETLCPST